MKDPLDEKRVVVPEGMLNAAEMATSNITTGQWVVLRDGLEAALRWLSEYPIEPSKSQQREIAVKMAQYQNARMGKFEPSDYHIWFPIHEWQCIMFLEPEPEIPKEIADLILVGVNEQISNKNILEAYRRGKAAR